MNCENCSIPQAAYQAPGYFLTLQFMPQIGDRWKRQQRRTVYACGSECAVQTMAIAAMGLPTHKWPMTFKEFVSQMKAAGKLDFLSPEKRNKLLSQVVENTKTHPVEFAEGVLGHLRRIVTCRGTPELTVDGKIKALRSGGRPASENPNANARRQRRYRLRKAQRA